MEEGKGVISGDGKKIENQYIKKINIIKIKKQIAMVEFLFFLLIFKRRICLLILEREEQRGVCVCEREREMGPMGCFPYPPRLGMEPTT